MPLFDDIRHIKKIYKAAIMSKPNVVGVGTGFKNTNGQVTNQLSIITLVRQKLPSAQLSPEHRIPDTLDGIATDVFEVGDVLPQLTNSEHIRPAAGGVSIGHQAISSGTFGGVVRDRRYNTRLILSNNHVLANTNNAHLGDPILQPGPALGGRLQQDLIGYLARYVTLKFVDDPSISSTPSSLVRLALGVSRLLNLKDWQKQLEAMLQTYNLVDAAVARPMDENAILDEIQNIGLVRGAVTPTLGMQVRKSGRTTGLTSGKIVVLDSTITIRYGINRSARFEDQIITSPMSQGGDSGSLVVFGDPPRAVGLLFAGSTQATVINPIHAVLQHLDVII
jgi:hypothetical protein